MVCQAAVGLLVKAQSSLVAAAQALTYQTCLPWSLTEVCLPWVTCLVHNTVTRYSRTRGTAL